jgi:hypothetical protein
LRFARQTASAKRALASDRCVLQGGAWAVLRKVSIRAHSWINWLYPLNM